MDQVEISCKGTASSWSIIWFHSPLPVSMRTHALHFCCCVVRIRMTLAGSDDHFYMALSVQTGLCKRERRRPLQLFQVQLFIIRHQRLSLGPPCLPALRWCGAAIHSCGIQQQWCGVQHQSLHQRKDDIEIERCRSPPVRDGVEGSRRSVSLQRRLISYVRKKIGGWKIWGTLHHAMLARPLLCACH